MSEGTRKNNTNLENTLRRERKKLEFASILFMIVGASSIASVISINIFNKTFPAITETIGGIVFLIALFIVFLQGTKFIAPKLKSRDEFEARESMQAKAKAFNLLNTGVLFILLFPSTNNDLTMGLLLVLLGGSWLIVARNNGYIDAE